MNNINGHVKNTLSMNKVKLQPQIWRCSRARLQQNKIKLMINLSNKLIIVTNNINGHIKNTLSMREVKLQPQI